MKRLEIAVALVTLMAVFVFVSSVARLQANPSPHGDVSGFCSENNDFGYSHGDCVSIGETNVNALADRGITDGVTICRILENAFGPFPLGRCVTHFVNN